MVVVGILAPNLHQFHRTTTEKYIFWRIKSQYVKFGFFGEKSTVKNIKGSLAAYVKRMRTWKCLKTKEILDLNGPWYYQPIWMFWQHWKKIKNSLHLYSQTCFCSHCGILKSIDLSTQVFMQSEISLTFSLGKQKPCHEACTNWLCDLRIMLERYFQVHWNCKQT